MSDFSIRHLPKSTRRLLRFSQIRLYLTNLVIETWPVLTLPLFYAGLSFFNVFNYMPWWLHSIVLLSFFILMLYFLRGSIKKLRWPDIRTVMRQMEVSAHVPHRPLNNLTDKLSPATRGQNQIKLWRIHLLRAKQQLQQIRLLRPERNLKQKDPYRLGFIAVAIFALGFLMAGHERSARLSHALTMPRDIASYLPSYTPHPVHFAAWLTPPEFAQQDTRHLFNGNLPPGKLSGTYTVPQDSTLSLHVSNLRGFMTPQFYANGEKQEPVYNDKGHYSLDLTFAGEGTHNVEIRYIFRTRIAYSVSSVADAPPEIVLNEEIRVNDRQEIEWSYQAKDDYGIAALDMYITPGADLRQKLATAPLTHKEKQSFNFSIPVPNDPAPRTLSETRTTDMTESPFAGYSVVINMVAEDTQGQIGESNPVETVLPVRNFEHPVAQKLVEIRDTLAWSDNPAERLRIWTELRNIAANPEAYRHDTTIFLSLAVAHMTLERLVASPFSRTNRKTEAEWLERMRGVRDLLWKTALHIEDGNLAIAARDLQNVLQKMKEKLDRGEMTEEEFQELAMEFQETMMRYMQALSETLSQKMQERQQQDGEERREMSQEMMERLTERMDMGNMFQQWQDFSQGGSPEDLQNMIEQMQNFIDQMDPDRINNAEMFDDSEFDMLHDLMELIENQQDLIEETRQTHYQSSPEDRRQDEQRQQQQQQTGDDRGEQQQQQQAGDDRGEQQQQQQAGDDRGEH